MSRSEVRECGWCLNEFIFRERPEKPEILTRLMIRVEHEPVICDDCLGAIGSGITQVNHVLK